MTDVDDVDVTARQLVEFYAGLGHKVASHPDGDGALAAITQVAVQTVPGASFASITRGVNSGFRTVAPTHGTASALDQLQYDLDSGPCLDAIRTRNMSLAPSLTLDRQWPGFATVATDKHGVRGVLAVHMMFDESSEVVSALNIYSARDGALTDASVTVALLLAAHGALAVSRVIARERATNLERALTSNREIGMAMGVLMATHKLSRDQAFDLLRIASQDSHRKLHEIAREVIETGMLNLPARSSVDRKPR